MRPALRPAFLCAGAVLLAHAIGNPHDGFFRDELYFIVCGRRPAWGYVDQPLLVPLLAAGSQLFGRSLFLLRLVPALFAAGSVYVTCRLAAELGGGRFAQVFAGGAAALSPVLLNFGMKISTDMPGLLLWPLAALCIVRVLRGADPRLWLGAGAALGLSFEAKYSVVFCAAALVLGLLATDRRRALTSGWFWAAVALATLLSLPSVLWQWAHGFPMLELLRNGQLGKNIRLGPLQFLAAELLITNPALALIWLTGLIWLLARRPTRWLGIAYLALIAMMIALHAKHYYPADVYPILFAAGGVAIEAWTAPRAWARKWLASAVAAFGAVLVPYALPVLPIPTFIAYDHVVAPLLHLEATRTEHLRPAVLPQDFADMHGWPELAAQVAEVYASLPLEEQQQAVIVASNYGEAAALDFFGGGAPVYSGHNQYFLWGPPVRSGEVLIDVNGDCGQDLGLYRSSTLAATLDHPYAMPHERNIPIRICRGLNQSLASVWPKVKMYF